MDLPSDRAREVSTATSQGERNHQEDRAVHVWTGTGWLLGVFDGHRGAAVSETAAKILPSLFETHLKSRAGNVSQVLQDVFAALNEMARDQFAGSTASVVFIPEDAKSVHLAVLGDSPVAILDAEGKIHIGPDHNVRTNLKERFAAEDRGGIYQGGYLEDAWRPGTGLQMARCLGDTDMARVLNREPEIETVALGGKGIVLVGTDGLLLPGGGANADQLMRLLSLIRDGADAEALVKDALARRTRDNVTAIVWQALRT